MMNLKTNVISLAVAALLSSAGGAAWAAEPTSGAYVTDTQNTWVQDQVGDRISTVNMIMCVMGALRADAMVNSGTYLALVDQNKCSGRSDSAKADSTSAGESNATDYMNAVVESTQASSTDPLYMKAWITMETGDERKMLISVYGVATAGKSDAYPNGLFSLNYCGQPAGAPSGSTCVMQGMLRSDADGLSFYEAEMGGGGGGGGGGVIETKMALLTSSPDAGGGQVEGIENGTSFQHRFAYDGSNFRRSHGTVDACFSRDKTLAEYSTWRYGTYNEDGSRLNSSNPGFPVKYVNGSDTYHGFWSFWGLWLPDSAMANVGSSGTLSRRVGDAEEVLTVSKKGGKLWKLTRQDSSLSAFKNIPMTYWAATEVGSGINQLIQGKNYELQWDGTHLLATREQTCSPSGCQQDAISPPKELQASDFRAASVRVLPIFFPSGGGNGAVRVDQLNEFSGDTALSYRTRTLVAPDAADAPSTLYCLGMCPKSGANLVSAFSSNPPAPFRPQSWGPVLPASATTYTFTNGMLTGGSGEVDGSSVATSSLKQYQGGIMSGSLVEGSNLSALQCDGSGVPNVAGDHLCPSLVDRADVSYQWETGPNKWNQYFGAAGITIDPPKSLSFAVTADNIRSAHSARFVGNTQQLQFSGFGELQGIPGHCVNPEDNAPKSCGPHTRYVPGFDIVDGSVVTEGATNYYVKYLERELRLSKLTGDAETSCKATLSLPTGLTMPDATSLSVNPVVANGPMPVLNDPKPSVIDGIVQ